MKVLFIPLEAIGHINSAVGIAQVLIDAGHSAVFFVSRQWKGRLVKYGVEEVLFNGVNDRPEDEDPAQYWSQYFYERGYFTAKSPLDKLIQMRTCFHADMLDAMKEMDVIIEQMLPTIRPDVIVLDYAYFPSVERSGIPWVMTCSCNPLLAIDDERTPPLGSGLSSFGDRNEWKVFRDSVNESTIDIRKQYNEYVVSCGLKPLKKELHFRSSPFMNLYSFPEELDYTDVRPLPERHYRFNTFMRYEVEDKQFEIPPELRHKRGKLIYFSMGSMGAADIPMMKRLIAILGKSQHRFIVSKGVFHDKYELEDNMWGQAVVPQTRVLPLVDLVITHGGNNTVTETFYFGKPLIVMPLFYDQFDNAQRVEDLGFGRRLDPHLCTEDSLLHSIEYLLSDNVLNERLYKISQRIQTDNCLAKVTKLFESLVVKNETTKAKSLLARLLTSRAPVKSGVD